MTTVSIEVPPVAATAPPPGRRRPRMRLPAALALLPTALVVLVVYVGCMLWTVRLSFTSSTLLPRSDWVGLTQYWRLFANDRFVTSAENIVIFGVLFISGCLVLGFLLAVFIDQNVRGEGVFRTIFLYPYAMSFVVTGRGLAVVPQSRPRAAEARARHGLRELHLRLARQPGHGDLHHRHRGAVARGRA